MARVIAKTIIVNYEKALQKDAILVNLGYGYDIGIAQKWASSSHSFNPTEFISSKK